MSLLTANLLAFVASNVFIGVLIAREVPLLLIAVAAFGASWIMPDKQVGQLTAVLGFGLPGLVIGIVGSELWDRTFLTDEQKTPPH